MAEFNNQKNEAAAARSLKAAETVCFGLSTISSSIAIWSAAMAFLDTKFDASSYISISIGAFAVVLYVCYLIDFFGISKVGKLFFTEIAAMFSGVFASYGALRKISMILWACIFASFFAISFITSYRGSDIVKAIATPKGDVGQFERIGDARAKAQNQLSSGYEQKREKVAADRATALKAVGTPNLHKLAKSGDAYAQTLIKNEMATVNKKFDNQLAAIDKDERAEKTTFTQSQDALDAAKLQAAQSSFDAMKAQADALGIVTMAGGVAPLIIGVIIIGVISVTEVSQAAERVAKGAKSSQQQPPVSGGHTHQSQHYQNFP